MQWKFVFDLLQDTSLTGCKLCDTHVDPKHKLKEDDSDLLLDAGRYQRLVANPYTYISLDWTLPTLSVNSCMLPQDFIWRLCIGFLIISRAAQGKASWMQEEVIFVWRRRSHFCVEAYRDADWAGFIVDWFYES